MFNRDRELDVVEASRLHEASSRELSQIEREIKLNSESAKKKQNERDGETHFIVFSVTLLSGQ